jgi:6-phosphogluconolactonase
MQKLNIYPDLSAVAAAFAADFAAWTNQIPSSQRTINVALSGGSTPKKLFEIWANQYSSAIDWSRIHFFWGDERCVPPMDPESNFGVANELFLEPVNIFETNIHRVRGEDDPAVERDRYETEIRENVSFNSDGHACFDLVILGMGDDGHTASIFPHQMELLESHRLCEVATHPESGQRRITLTGQVLNNADRVAFLITGENKAEVLAKIIHRSGDYEVYPTSHVNAKQVDYYLDESAASELHD